MEAAEQSMWRDAAAELSAMDMEDEVYTLSNNPFAALDEGALRTAMAHRDRLREERIAEGVRRRAAALADRERIRAEALAERERQRAEAAADAERRQAEAQAAYEAAQAESKRIEAEKYVYLAKLQEEAKQRRDAQLTEGTCMVFDT
jgi:hypothetical protein